MPGLQHGLSEMLPYLATSMNGRAAARPFRGDMAMSPDRGRFSREKSEIQSPDRPLAPNPNYETGIKSLSHESLMRTLSSSLLFSAVIQF